MERRKKMKKNKKGGDNTLFCVAPPLCVFTSSGRKRQQSRPTCVSGKNCKKSGFKKILQQSGKQIVAVHFADLTARAAVGGNIGRIFR